MADTCWTGRTSSHWSTVSLPRIVGDEETMPQQMLTTLTAIQGRHLRERL
jgi:hypothetical protein